MNEQLFQVLRKLISKNDIRVNQKELKRRLLSQPSYPSLYALTRVLNHFKINSIALRLPTNEETIRQLPACWIAQVEQNRGSALVLIEKKGQKYYLFNAIDKVKALSEADFLKIWKGVLLAIEKDEATIEEKYYILTKLNQWVLILSGVALIIFFSYSLSTFFPVAHFLLSISGLATSIRIMGHELGLQLRRTDRICNRSEKTSCDAVLHSRGAHFLGILKLSDMSLLSFSTFILVWVLILLTNSNNYSIMVCLSLLAIPMLVYSLYHQARLIKKWCPLCLGLGIILGLQAISIFSLTTFSFYISLQEISFFAVSLLLTSSIWFYLKPLLKDQLAYQQLQIDYNAFKFNFPFFKTILESEQSLIHSVDIPQEIVFGKLKAPLEIILISNPLCFFCKEVHQLMERILDQEAADQVKIIIRFSIDINDRESIDFRIAHQLISVYHTQGPLACRKLMAQVYHEDFNPERWILEQKTNPPEKYQQVLELQYEWCLANEIHFTPALYLNGKAYPDKYQSQDLIYFIDELIEHHTGVFV